MLTDTIITALTDIVSKFEAPEDYSMVETEQLIIREQARQKLLALGQVLDLVPETQGPDVNRDKDTF
jgi:hypothetical protein